MPTAMRVAIVLTVVAGGSWLLVRAFAPDDSRRTPPGRKASPSVPPARVKPVADVRTDRVVAGRVLAAETGAAIAGASVRVACGEWEGSAASGTDGDFSVRPEDDDYALSEASVSIRCAGYLPVESGRLGEREDYESLRFELKPAAALRGRIVAANGNGIAGATVRGVGWKAPEGVELDTTTTAADGSYSFPAVPPGRFDLTIQAPGFLPSMRFDLVAKPGASLELQTVSLVPGRTVRVRVENGGAGTTVLAYDVRLPVMERDRLETLVGGPPDRSFFDKPVVVSKEPSADGVFVLAGLGPGPVHVEARRPGFLTVPGVGTVSASEDAEIELRLVPGIMADIRFLDAGTRERLIAWPPCDVRLTYAGRTCVLGPGYSVYKSLAGEQGYLLPADGRPHVLRIGHPGYRSRELRIPALTPASPRPEFEAPLEPTGRTASIELALLPDSLAYAVVAGRVRSSGEWWARPGLRGSDYWGLSHVPVGVSDVVVFTVLNALTPVAATSLTVTPNAMQRHRVKVDEGGLALAMLRVWATDEQRRLLADVGLKLRRLPGGEPVDAVFSHPLEDRLHSDRIPGLCRGRESIVPLPPGRYAVTATCAGFAETRQEFVAEARKTVELRLVFKR